MDRPVTRALLLIVVSVVVVNAVFVVGLLGGGSNVIGPMFAAPPEPSPLVAVPILGFLGSVFGLWRMWRLTRGPR